MVTPATSGAAAKPPRLHDVKTKPLRVIPDERKFLMEMLRNDDQPFAKFGQAYISATSEYRLEPHGTLPYDWERQDG